MRSITMKHPTLSGYTLLERLSEDRSGVIFRSVHKSSHKPVLLKKLKLRKPSPSEIAEFRQEFTQITQTPSHGIITLYDLIENSDGIALVMEDFNGVAVSDLLLRNRLLLDVFLGISIQVAKTLGELHQADLTHRAVRPDTILIDIETGDVKLTGFGAIAQLTHENETISDPEIVKKVLGYISPEQTGRMNRPIDYRTDLYALGVSFYHMLTGRPPFEADNPMEMFHAHIAKTPVTPSELFSDIPLVLSDIIMQLIRKAPEERYQNSFGLQADLETCRQNLSKTGSIPYFDIGTKDISKRFNIPQKLYGRQGEIAKLLACYENVCAGEKALMMIAGSPGIGKTALTRELDKTIVEKKGYFISGKYEQLRKDVPLSAFIQALIGMVREMLSGNPHEIAAWQERIMSAVSPNGKVLTDVIPDIALIIGSQPDVPELDSEQTRNRFNFVFERFVEAIAQSDHPVVLFLDDLQWADLPSLDLLERITGNHTIKNLFIIGSYRDSDVSPSHPLTGTLAQIEKKDIPVHRIHLKPLLEYDIRQLIVDFLKTTHEQGAHLASLVYEKTGGNPFFVSQFLKNLFEMNIITFDMEKGWTWDNVKLRSMQVTDNLVDLLVDKINRLAPETRDVLKVCACIGNRFDLDMIALMLSKPIAHILPGISEAIREGLIGKTSLSYVFHHDRIQEAVYSLIPDGSKSLYHYRVGHLEHSRSDNDVLQNKLFYIVDQLKAGLSHIVDDEEKNNFIVLCLKAGNKAKTSAAYAPSALYFKTGLNLLDSSSWDSHYQLSFDLHRGMLECLYLTGHYDDAEKLFDIILSKAKSSIDIANVSSLMVTFYTSQGDYKKALQTGYQAAKIVGKPIPEKSNSLHVAFALLRLWITFRKNKIEDVLDFPEMKDPAVLSYAYLYSYTGTVIYYIDPHLFAFTVIEGNLVTLKNGNWEYADFGFNALGCIVGSSLGFYKQGYRFGKVALTLSERKPGKTNRCRINFLFAMMILPWTEHANGSIDYFRRAYKLGLECGDILFSSHSINLSCMYRIMLGHPLDDILDEYKGFDELMATSKDPFVRKNYLEKIQYLHCMKGLTKTPGYMDGDNFSEEENLKSYIDDSNKLAQFYFLTDLLRLRYVFGNFDEALALVEELRKLTRTNVGLGCLHNGDINFYHSLSLTAIYPRKGKLERMKIMARLKLNQMKMKVWAENSPSNFRHKHTLVEAAIHTLKKRHIRAVRAYRSAIRDASESGYRQHEALGNELYARYFQMLGHMDVSSYYYTEACGCYQRLGYQAKADHLRKMNLEMIQERLIDHGTSAKTTTDALDLSTVIKASQAISGEIYLGKLLTAMLSTTMENVGAERGFLILEHNNTLVVEAEGNLNTGVVRTLHTIPLEKHEGLSRAMVNFTARTGETLILHNASVAGDFTRDPYVLKHQPKSVLCLPVFRQGKRSAIIYFENNLTTNAFLEDRIELLKILSSQAAISIDNARLYEQMEEKVKTRTRELDQSLRIVEESNKRTMDSIAYASRIQQSLLPDKNMTLACLPDSFFIWQPRDIIGGDIYYVESIGQGFVLTLIDCTGHGVPGAFMTVLAVSGLKRIIHEDKEYNPADILKKLNRFVQNSLRQDTKGAQSDDGLDAAVITCHTDKGILQFAGARMGLHMVSNKTLTIIKGDRQSIGYVGADTAFNFRLHTINDLYDTCFYLSTDGFIDQHGGVHNRRFGSKSFQSLILNHHEKPMDQQKEELLKAFARHKGMDPYTDDVTVAGFRISRM